MHAGFTWDVPERFNFTRDVVEPLAADPYRRALTFVDRTGLVERITFAELATDAARWAHLLRTRGYGQGDRVLVMLGKVPAWLGVMLGAIKAGLVTVPCSEMLRSRDIAFRARNSGARLVVADPAFQAELDGARSLVDDPLDVLYLDDAQLLLRRQPLTADTEETLWCDEAMILYTSGTTKHPKGATHSHAYLFATRMQAEHWLDARPGDLVWCTAGTGWAKSIWNVLVGPWSRGAEIVLHDGAFDEIERLTLLESLGVTILCQAPTEYRLLAKLDELGARPLPALRHAVSAGEPLNPEVIARFRDALGVTIYDGYGQTENTLLVANTPERAVRPGSMGWPTPGHRVAVIDEEGHEAADGAEGDIALHGRPPSLFMRYWNAPNETGDAFRGDWYVTGDRATRDEDGSIWFTGRADDVILSAAYRIGPFEVESALLEHPAVAESAVVGKPDPERGQIVKAFVVLRAGHKPTRSLVKELQSHAKRITAPYKYPREIEFVAELPKTASGKIRRVELREAGAVSGAATAGAAETEPRHETVAAATTAPPASPEKEAVTPATSDAAAGELLGEAPERRRADEERQRSAAEAQRAHDAERERSQRELERAERERHAAHQRAAEDAARAAAEHAERRRREDEGRQALTEAEQRRRSEQRRVDEQRAVARRRRSLLAAAPDDQRAAAASVTQLSPRGSRSSRRDDPGGGRAA